ncbi:MAG: endonuclease III domain-containing protein [Inquilinaceae bacterium]
MTTSPSYERVYDRLKATLADWQELLEIRIEELTSIIADAGLATQRAERLKVIAYRLEADFGRVTLTPIAEAADEAVLGYLTALPGVGVKSAKCVMMYSLGRQVLPVDTHTARLAGRLGLISSKNLVSADRELVDVVPPHNRYGFHVNAVAHGREVCRAVRPRCDACVLRRICRTGSSDSPAIS